MKLLFLCLLLISTGRLTAQGIGIGTVLPDSSSIVEIKSTSHGVLLPRLTTSQRNLIDDPVQGLLVFDTDKNTLYMFDGHQWLPLASIADPLSFPPRPVQEATGLEGDDNWGSSVDIDGNYAIIGAPNDDIESDTNQGSAYIYFKGNGAWEEQEKLTVTNPGSPHDHFGTSVAISGDYAIVGAPETDLGGIDKGNVYIFFRNGTNWTQIARLRAVDANAGAHFGCSVDMDGDYAVVGAYDADTIGKAYVFYKDSAWITNQPYQEKLTGYPVFPGPFGILPESFGWSVSMDSNEIVVGDPKLDLFGTIDYGLAYIFTRSDTNWFTDGIFYPVGGAANDEFGHSVSLNGDYAIIGAHHDDIGANSSQGSVYVYFRGAGWTDDQTQQTKLTAPDGAAMDAFGTAVSISGDHIVVSAPNKNISPASDVGGGYLFKRNGGTWPLIRLIDDEIPKTSAFFGSSICLDGYTIFIGAPGKNDGKGEIQHLNIE